MSTDRTATSEPMDQGEEPRVTEPYDTSVERALAEHFYAAACQWAEWDGEPVEGLVFDRFVVAAQDWLLSRG